jgi:hypothetical protein
MFQDPKEDRLQSPPARPASPPRRRKTARVVCARHSEFWTTQKQLKQFWAWVREGVVTQTGDSPLTGRFEGRREKLIVLVNHVMLDAAAPEHKAGVLKSYDYRRPRRPDYPVRPFGKRPR